MLIFALFSPPSFPKTFPLLTSLLRRNFPLLSIRSPPPPPIKMSSSSSWSCSTCTFLNSPSQKTHCKICLSSSSSSSSSSSWYCFSCTFANSPLRTSCEVCLSQKSSPPTVVDVDTDDISALPTLPRCGNKHPLASPDGAHKEKISRKGAAAEASEEEAAVSEEASGFAEPNSNKSLLKIMSYNVWFREDLELNNRMDAIGDLIQQHSPDIICLQEVTPEIYDIFKKSTWWKTYKCSLSQEKASHRAYFCMQMSKLPTNFNCKPFDNTIMGRELCLADINIGAEEKLVIATSHLESPCPGPPRWDQMFSKERVAQAKMSVDLLKSYPNVILCGDMNWDDKSDGAFPLDDGWVDAWMQLKSGEDGWTYDTKANPMLSGNRKLQKRLDRFLCNLRDFKIDGIDMIGMEVIPGLSHRKKVGKAGKELVLPVLPSDHFGLLLTIHRL